MTVCHELDLGAVPRFFLGEALVVEFSGGWPPTRRSLFVVAGWPVRAVRAPVPGVSALPLAICGHTVLLDFKLAAESLLLKVEFIIFINWQCPIDTSSLCVDKIEKHRHIILTCRFNRHMLRICR